MRRIIAVIAVLMALVTFIGAYSTSQDQEHQSAAIQTLAIE